MDEELRHFNTFWKLDPPDGENVLPEISGMKFISIQDNLQTSWSVTTAKTRIFNIPGFWI